MSKNPSESQSTFAELERCIRIDPARRGLISSEPEFGPLLFGQLPRAIEELARRATSVWIVTGFFIPSANPPAAETDGPLGSILLAETLRQLGVKTQVLTDQPCATALQATARGLNFPSTDLVSITTADDAHFEQLLLESKVSHLISIERVGPNYTRAELQAALPNQPDIWKQFEQTVPMTDRNQTYNMRGICIDEWTAPLHRVFEIAKRVNPSIKTIGVGDGGNEIGMGSVPWWELARRLPEPHGGKIACRIPCDWTILAGVSNWGGYALAAGIAWLRDRLDILEPWTATQQLNWLADIVKEGPAVDGVTRLFEPTVDGLPFAAYIEPWDAMRQLIGLPR